MLTNAVSKQKLHFASKPAHQLGTTEVNLRVVSTAPNAPLKAKKRKRIHSNDRDEVKRNLLMSSFPSCGPMYWESDDSSKAACPAKRRLTALVLPTHTQANDRGEDILTDGVFEDAQQYERPTKEEEEVSELGDEGIEDESTQVPSPMTAAQRLRAGDDHSEQTFRQEMQQSIIDDIKGISEAMKEKEDVLLSSPEDDEYQDDDFTADSSWAERFKLALWKTFSPGIL